MGMWASQDGSIKEESWGYTTNTYSNDSKYMCFFPNGFMFFSLSYLLGQLLD